MSDPGTRIYLDVLAPQAAEHPAFKAAARNLSQLLRAASGKEHEIRLNLHASLNLGAIEDAPGVIIVSLLGEVNQAHVEWAGIAARWRRQASALVGGSARPVFLCTVFRHVPAAAPRSLIERIRRLNLLVAELSQATGANVIDIDRTMAHFGARLLATDYTARGRIGPEVAGDVIAAALLEVGLDEVVAGKTLEKARRLHGGLDGLSGRLNRYLASVNAAAR